MAKNQTRRIRPVALEADKDACTSVQALTDYKPANAAFASTALATKLTAMQTAQQAEVKAENALAAAHDNAVAAEWDFHNAMLGAKAQVAAQYGPDSNELQSLGIKKKSEYKAPSRKKEVSAA